MQFISFSSGSSGNCYLLKSSGGTLLLDAGLSPRKVKQYLSACGLSLSDIDAILITRSSGRRVRLPGLYDAGGARGHGAQLLHDTQGARISEALH